MKRKAVSEAVRVGGRPGISRRALLGGVPALLLGGPAILRSLARAEASSLIVRRPTPLLAEMAFEKLQDWLTPNDAFFVLSAFGAPRVEAGTWRLTVDGEVEQPLSLTYDDLKAFPAKTKVALLECAGNSRSTVKPPPPGTTLGIGYVGNARWKGVPLQDVLARAGLKASGREVVFRGADAGKFAGLTTDVHFEKSVPLEKALHPATLLVYEMNDSPLPVEHGFPVRALVPGWYGTYSVKWLTAITVLDHAFEGPMMTRAWLARRRLGGLTRMEPISQIAVKSQIAQPAAGATISPGTHRIFGAAWAGGVDIAAVEVSADEGRTWRPARLLEPYEPYAWRFWESWWTVTQPGTYTLMSRAIDASGRVQPPGYDRDLNGFEVNQVQAVTFEVR